MFYVDAQVIECSECGSKDHEHVTHHNSKFKRCRGCGHEGRKTNVMPEMGGDSVGLHQRDNKPQTF